MQRTWIVTLLLVVGTSCSKPKGAAEVGSAGGSAGSVSPTTGSGAAPKSGSRVTTVVDGQACPIGTVAISDTPIKLDGATLSFERDRGGGCPTRPVYTVAYTKASPMPVRLCYDQTADQCEMYIKGEKVAIDLTDALKASGATVTVLAK